MLRLLLAALLLADAPTALPSLRDPKLRWTALTDGQGHYVVYDQDKVDHLPGGYVVIPLLSGDATALYLNRTRYQFGQSDWFRILFWEPRGGVYHAENRFPTNGALALRTEDGVQRFEARCGKKNLPLTPVGAEELDRLKATATVHGYRWTRRPDKLMRDDAGTYFLIDRLETDPDDYFADKPDPFATQDRRDFRVFMGPRGNMKRLPLKNVVDDSEGSIFATKDGVLRLITTDRKNHTQVFKWVVGGREALLTDVPVRENEPLIYLDLGPYGGQPLGTPCDPIW